MKQGPNMWCLTPEHNHFYCSGVRSKISVLSIRTLYKGQIYGPLMCLGYQWMFAMQCMVYNTRPKLRSKSHICNVRTNAMQTDGVYILDSNYGPRLDL